MPYREKKIISGPMFEVEIFPISLKERNKSRKKKSKESVPEMKNLNDKNAKKHLIRLVNTNFNNKDIAIYLSYTDKTLPKTESEARTDINNYLRRVKRYRQKNGLPPLKYIAVIEYIEPDKFDKRKRVRMHHHLIMSGMDRDTAEQLWGKGRANARRLQADDYGYEGLARYVTKDPNGNRRWTQSKNLKKPKYPRPNDSKYNKRMVEKMAHYCDDKELFEKKYPGYTFLECKVEVNKLTDAVSLYIKMRLKDKQCKPKRELKGEGYKWCKR